MIVLKNNEPRNRTRGQCLPPDGDPPLTSFAVDMSTISGSNEPEDDLEENRRVDIEEGPEWEISATGTLDGWGEQYLDDFHTLLSTETREHSKLIFPCLFLCSTSL